MQNSRTPKILDGRKQRVFGKTIAPSVIPTNLDYIRPFVGVSNLKGVYGNIGNVLLQNDVR